MNAFQENRHPNTITHKLISALISLVAFSTDVIAEFSTLHSIIEITDQALLIPHTALIQQEVELQVCSQNIQHHTVACPVSHSPLEIFTHDAENTQRHFHDQ